MQKQDKQQKYSYQAGFGNVMQSEAIEGALPERQNSPQRCPYGLYAEQLNGTSFLMPRHQNLKSWLYRIQPSVTHGAFKPVDNGLLRSRPFDQLPPTPEQLRFDPFDIATLREQLDKAHIDFIDGLFTICGNGDSASYRGSAVHIYCFDTPMQDKYFVCSDGDFLLVPQLGTLDIATEFGGMTVAPGEIAVIPRGIRYKVNDLHAEQDKTVSRGYILENYGAPFILPPLGAIGANGLANPRHFLSPTASIEHQDSAERQKKRDCQLINKFAGNLWTAWMDHSPLDVVAWHGNYLPYKYDLSLFNTINTVSFDHPDPSIFTVLTSPSEVEGIANVDFVIFPPRWMVAEDTFRPPYYHRNVMSEYMGLIHGMYDAKQQGFVPGGGSLHNAMSAHGPDAETFQKASQANLAPTQIKETLAFMFESSLIYAPTQKAMDSVHRQTDYLDCWQNLKSNFKIDKSD
ncbi:MAG: homogentisate 1,2-dioxygenase [Candidatus Melainabacteria bacterium]|nr:homogentisate 1,2-dioxygenase [Candidatus Melainabacteria bacterium]